ncbi:MAG: transpeptidase family protein [Anaeromyxobacter sp.]|nr:transpeptidase family protein [Anaeromyxobacter sp.]MBL0275654.1 transpeptidase family protein [Anaeromyxobacter sp.]
MRPGPDPKSTRWIAIRIGLVGLLFLGGFGAVAWRAVSLQVVQRDKLSAEARDQYVRQVVMTPRRGVIVDRAGQLLAQSGDAESVFVDPSELEARAASPARALAQLARALRLDPRALARKVDRGGARFVWVKRRISPAEASAVRRLDLPGVQLLGETRRYYPKSTLASQVIGLTGDDGTGLEGIELQLDEVLRGEPAKVPSLRDGRGRVALQDVVGSNRAREGARVELTLDQGLQLTAEQALGAAVKGSRALSGVAIALDPATGEVLAMASWPPVDPNALKKGDEPRNRAVSDAFEPGSTVKAFTIAGALDRGVLRPGDAIDCGAGYTVGGHVIHDHKSIGWAGPAKVLAASSNVGAARIGARLGKRGLSEVLAAFGFGQRTGVALPGERKGLLPYPRSDIALATQSFGQGLTASALQVVSAMGAIANGGRLMEPRLVLRTIDPADGAVIEEPRPQVVRQVVSPATAATVARWLAGVVEDPDGTGKRARPDGWRVAGKTGTAQKADPVTGGYSADRHYSSFVGFAPAQDPRVVIGVFIDEPKGEIYGGEVAAPPFRDIASYALKMLGVPPEPSDVAAGAAAATRAASGGAAATPAAAPGPTPPAALASTRARPASAEDDEAEPAEPPAVEVAARRLAGSTGGVAVPALAGLPVRAALRTLEALDLGAEVTGSGRVTRQSPPPGRVVARGARIRLTLAPAG